MYVSKRAGRFSLLGTGLGLAIGLAACTQQTPPQAPKAEAPKAQAPAASPQIAPPPAASPVASPAAKVATGGASPVAQTGTSATAEVKMQNLRYQPETITIAPGTKVTWTQLDTVPHTVTSGKPGASDFGKLFNQNVPNLNETFSYTFNEAGTFDYFCVYHLPQMVGQVVVQPGGGDAAKATTPQPTATQLPLPERFTTVGPGQALQPPYNAKLAAGGLQNPRGFTWGPDGAIYVAESGSKEATGLPGTESDESRVGVLFCEGWKQHAGEPPPPNCPQGDPKYLKSGRVSRIDQNGVRTTVVDGLPVIVGMFGFAEGPASVAFVGEDLYVLITHTLGKDNLDGFNTGVYRINPDKSGTLISALDLYNRDHPPKVVPPDFDLSEPHDMIELNRKLYVTDGNAGVIFEIDPAAPEATRTRHIADLSGVDDTHPVLTGLSAGPDGNLYVTNLTKAPYPQGGAKIWQVTVPDGRITEWATGLTLGAGLAVAPDNTFYVAEFASVIPRAPFIAPGGRVVKTTRGGAVLEVNSSLLRLFYPTMIRWGPDGDLYVTYYSIGGEGGEEKGAIYRFDFPPFDS